MKGVKNTKKSDLNFLKLIKNLLLGQWYQVEKNVFLVGFK